MKRKCNVCGNTILIDKNNSERAVHYKSKYYHYDCFNDLCDQRIASKRTSALWTEVKSQIDEFVNEVVREQQILIDKDELDKWLKQHYEISFINPPIYIKLDSIYKGTYKGLAYPILPNELLNEWQYYWNELHANRQRINLDGERAISYDLVILLSRNAEYRRIKEKEKIAQEIRAQQKAEELVINTSAIKIKRQSKNKIADLYKEMNGGEDNE